MEDEAISGQGRDWNVVKTRMLAITNNDKSKGMSFSEHFGAQTFRHLDSGPPISRAERLQSYGCEPAAGQPFILVPQEVLTFPTSLTDRMNTCFYLPIAFTLAD